MSGGLLKPALDAALSERVLQRVLLSGAEGLGRTRLLTSVAGLVVRVNDGTSVAAQTLRALLGEPADEEAALAALAAASPLQGLEPERAATAVELLASLLGIRRPDFRTARLDEDSRREGATLELARWGRRARAGRCLRHRVGRRPPRR
ncbi:MAG: hypothetical protein ACOZQL_15195 [Myxococcota bacterium]